MIAGHRGWLSLGLVLGLLALAIQVAVPAVARLAIDAAIDGDRDGLDAATIALIALGAGRMVFGGLYRFALFRTAYEIETDLRAIIYEHLTRLSFSFYDRTQSGQVISRANSDIRSIQVYLAFAPLVAMSVLTFVLALGLMLTIHVPLTLVSLATLPGVYIAAQRLRNLAFPLSWLTQARMADLATIVDENISGIRVVKSFAAEPRQVDLLARAAQRLKWSAVETIRARARYNPLIEALPRVGTALVLLYGGWLAIDDQVSIGTLFAFSAYVIMLQVPFRLLGFLLLQGERAGAAADRIYQILDEEPEIDNALDAVALDAAEGRVEFRNVSFSYPTATEDSARPAVLSGLSFTVEAGETVAVVGRTGSGKSTVARLLARFYDVDTGSVLLDGHDVRRVSLPCLRHSVGIVFDEPFLFSTTLRDNIAYGRPDASDDRIEAAARAAQAHDFVAALPAGYDTVVGERGYTLSGGQRQRIAIARTLLTDPAVLVLDDATSAVDVAVEARIHASLRRLLGTCTTILIAQRLSTIALADRVLLLDQGHVVATGTHRELLSSQPLYSEILADTGTSEAVSG